MLGLSTRLRGLDPGALIGAALAGLAASPAAAVTYTIDVANPLDIGSVVSATAGDTVFRINPASGVVAPVSGSGRRISTTNVRASVTVGCKPSRANETNCQTDNIRIRVGTIGAVLGRARALNNFSVAMGTATLAAPPTGTNPLSFQIGPVGTNQSKTFFIGADFGVAGDDSGLASGPGENGFYVYVVDAVGFQLAGDTDKGRVKALRALAIAKGSDLNFGAIQRPGAGTSTVTINAANGQRSIVGGAVGFPTPAPTAASFTVSGEGGQTFSLTIPATVNLTGPGALTVNLTNTAVPAPSLSGTLGGAGTYGFRVGGDLPLSPTTPTGTYAGVFVVSLDYN